MTTSIPSSEHCEVCHALPGDWCEPWCSEQPDPATRVPDKDEQIATLTAERDELRDKLRVVTEQNDALGAVNEACVQRDQLRAALIELCGIADGALMPNPKVTREWYEQHGDARIKRVAKIRALAEEDK